MRSYKDIYRLGSVGQGQVLPLNDFSKGLNTIVPPSRLAPQEMYACTNFEFTDSGGLRTRPGLVQYTNTAFDEEAIHMAYGPVGGTFYELFTMINYELYYLDGNKDPVEIGQLVGHAEIIFFNGVAVILDSSYIKTWDGTTLALAYDDGTGTNGYQINQLSVTQDTGSIVGNGTITRTGLTFTTQAWDATYTIPVTRVTAVLKKVGSPTGNATAAIYLVSTGALIGTSTTTLDVATLTTSYTENHFDFDLGDDLLPSTAYYASINYSGGSVPNHVLVATDTVASGGNGFSYSGSWSASAVSDPAIGVKPGRPPKAQFGLIISNRLVVSGSDDQPGWICYSNAGTYLDWSTADGGGYISLVDGDEESYEVTALIRQYGVVYVFGSKEQPFLYKLSGTTPANLTVSPVMDDIWSTQELAHATPNDAWFASLAGVKSLSGVQEFGDLRAAEVSDPINNIITQYFDANAIAAYNPLQSQYLLKLSNYNKILVGHLRNPIQLPDGKIRYPWTEWQFIRDNLTDSATYKWTASGSGTNEYYVELLAGGDPSLTKPHFMILDDRKITEGTVGSLTNLEWDHGDNDTLGYSTVYIRLDSADPDAAGYAISSILEVFAMGAWNEKFFIAGDNGHIYYLDSDICRDNSNDPRYLLATSYASPPFGTTTIERTAIQAYSQLGCDITFKLYKDYSTVSASFSQSLNVADSVTVGDLDEVAVRDADFLVTTTPENLWQWININCQSFMFALSDFSTRNTPIYIDGIYSEIRKVGR